MSVAGRKAAVLAAVASLAFVQSSQASWWKKHIVHPIEHAAQNSAHVVNKEVLEPAKQVVVNPVTRATQETAHVVNKEVLEPAKQELVNPVTRAAQETAHVANKEMVTPVVHHVEHPSRIWAKIKSGAQNTYYALSTAAHETFHGLRIADRCTLVPAKHAVTEYGVAPAWKGVSQPASWLAHQTVGLADQYLGMKGSILPGGKFLDDWLGWMGKKIGVKSDVFKMMDPLHDTRRVAGQVARDTPSLFLAVVGGAWDSVSLDPTRSVGAAEDIAVSGIAVGGNASMALVRPVVHAYAHGLMYQSPNATVIHPDGVPDERGNREVVYTNGIDTTYKDAAEGAATSLAIHLSTPIHLIWNEGGGGTGRKVLSVTEGVYDRISNAIAVGPLRMLNGDSTTRRLTGEIIEAARANKELALVGHSQGALEIAGALQAADSLGLGDYIREHVTVILTGTPLVSAEIHPKPKAIHFLHNAHDAVADLGGVNITNPASPGLGHSFTQDYLSSIDPKWIE